MNNESHVQLSGQEMADIETSSDDYARRFSGSTGAWFLSVQSKITLDILAPYSGARILDVGGGHGQIASTLVDHGYDVTVLGSDPSCRHRIESLVSSGRCQFDVGDLLHLPYPNRSFDVLISYRLLTHVNHWEQLLAEFTRVADKAVIIDYPEIQSLNILTPLLFPLKKGVEGNTRQYTCFRKAELRTIFQSLGFKVAEHKPEFLLPMVLHRALKSAPISKGIEALCRLTGLTSHFGSPVILKSVRAEQL